MSPLAVTLAWFAVTALVASGTPTAKWIPGEGAPPDPMNESLSDDAAAVVGEIVDLDVSGIVTTTVSLVLSQQAGATTPHAIRTSTFAAFSALTSLTIRLNVQIIEPNAFLGLSALQTLDLDENGLTELASNVFGGLPSLKTLMLAQNKITRITGPVFSYVPTLETLNLDLNQLGETAFPIDSGSALKNLSIASNNLASVDATMLLGLTGLETLSLKDNSITMVHEQAFASNAALVTLNLDHNRIRSLAWLPQICDTVVKLSLRINSISIVNENQFDCPAMKELYLNHNPLGNFRNTAVGSTSVLEKLDLSSGTSIGLESPILVHGASIKALGISGRRLGSVTAEMFSTFTNLIELDLSFNGISQFPTSAVGTMPRLRNLFLRDNLIGSLYDSSSTELELTTLNLDGNSIASLSAIEFTSFPKLRELYLRDNLLVALPDDTFSSTPLLERLVISDNQIITLGPNAFSGLTVLEHLDLSRNAFRDVPDIDLSELTSLVTFLFDGQTQLRSTWVVNGEIAFPQSLQVLKVPGNLCIPNADAPTSLYGNSVQPCAVYSGTDKVFSLNEWVDTCPSGSVAVNQICEAAVVCSTGLVKRNNRCINVDEGEFPACKTDFASCCIQIKQICEFSDSVVCDEADYANLNCDDRVDARITTLEYSDAACESDETESVSDSLAFPCNLALVVYANSIVPVSTDDTTVTSLASGACTRHTAVTSSNVFLKMGCSIQDGATPPPPPPPPPSPPSPSPPSPAPSPPSPSSSPPPHSSSSSSLSNTGIGLVSGGAVLVVVLAIGTLLLVRRRRNSGGAKIAVGQYMNMPEF